MGKKICTLFLCFIHISVHAASGSEQAQRLPEIFNDLKYDLEVNWDQNDKKQYEEIITRFNHNIEDLQSQGLGQNELISYVRGEILDQEAKQDLDAVLTSITVNKLTQEEASQLAIEQIANNGPTGSHWLSTGKIVSLVTIAAIMIVATIVVFKQMGKNKRGSSSSNLTCRERYVCINYNDINGHIRTDCDWEPYCY